uniref:Collagen, type VI, alpha 2 n=1 Tax=Nothobranchius kuhntae TaxID=321403 RepID=A0A1A8I9S0_NOTKU
MEVPGIPGRKGASGPKGVKGNRGKMGLKGHKGKQGDPGIEGSIGQPGLKGENGFKGEKGEVGLIGAKGVAGAPGKNGTDGQKGKIGRIGAPGCKGDPGDKGPEGHAGEAGDPGPPGESKRAHAKVSVVVVTDGRFDPADDDSLLRYLCNYPGVEVNAIGVGDMFDKKHDSETLVSVACNNKNRITEMKQYADLVAESFIERLETVLCPDPVIKCPDLPCKSELDVAPCVGRPVDLVFLLDGSERLGTENFNHFRSFVQQVASTLVMAKTRNDQNWARLALVEFGKENENEVAFPLTHDSNVISTGLSRLTYLDSSSSTGPAILHAIDNIMGKGNTRKTRRGAEVSFVFVTDGITNTSSLDKAVSAMRREQITSTVIATGNDVDQQVLTKLALESQEAIFKAPKFSDLLESSLFGRFIRWIC